MPTYKYKCDNCEAEQTETFSISVSLPAPTCENCKTTMTKIYTAPAITFRGTGWGGDHKKNGKQ